MWLFPEQLTKTWYRSSMQKGHNGVFWGVLLLVMGRAK
jgi:hypothetical protein